MSREQGIFLFLTLEFHLLGVKGIVHPKILSSFTHPQVFPNRYKNIFVLPNTKKDILKKVGNSSSGAPLTSIVGKNIYNGSQWCPRTDVSHILQNIFLCVQNKHIHTDSELFEGE